MSLCFVNIHNLRELADSTIVVFVILFKEIVKAPFCSREKKIKLQINSFFFFLNSFFR